MDRLTRAKRIGVVSMENGQIKKKQGEGEKFPRTTENSVKEYRRLISLGKMGKYEKWK